jgi:hypothetical protein
MFTNDVSLEIPAEPRHARLKITGEAVSNWPSEYLWKEIN